MESPHDKLFKLVYSRPAQAAAYFERFLPAGAVARLDLDRLELIPGSFVDDALAERHTDLLFRAPLRPEASSDVATESAGQEALVYLLFEHQSTVDALMAFRLLRYMLRIWERWLADASHARSLPPIIPLVLYQGEREWRAATSFEALVPDATGDLLRFTPRFDFLLTSLGALPEPSLTAVRDGVSRLALLMLRDGRAPDILSRLADWKASLLEAQVLQLLAGFLEYLLSVQDALDPRALGVSLRDTLNPQAEFTAMTVAEKLIEQGIAKGRAEGIATGRAEGIAKGIAKGQRATLLRLLTLRFGPVPEQLAAELEAADEAQLAIWIDRVITADSLDEVFSG